MRVRVGVGMWVASAGLALGGLCVVLVLYASLYLLNDSYSILLRPLSMEWPVVVRCCFCDLSGVVATTFAVKTTP